MVIPTLLTRNKITTTSKRLLLVVLFAIFLFNQILIGDINIKLGIKNSSFEILSTIFMPEQEKPRDYDLELTGNIQDDAVKIVMVKGTPPVYGQRLGVSYDNAQQSIDAMKRHDPILESFNKGEFARYVAITTKISCEFCCTVESLTYDDGKPTCGCDHAKAMRGLAAYLIKNFGNEFSNSEILRELAKWKGLYFPKQMTQKLIREIASGKYSQDIEVLLGGIEIPEYKINDKLQDIEIKNVPDMVGEC